MLNPADISVFFADFAQTATVLISGTRVGDISILWEAPGRVASPFGGIETTAPAALIATTAVNELGITHGAQLVVADTDWYVVALEPDGAGLTRLILSRDSDN